MDAVYRHYKKSTISPPFNFQHVSHTQPEQLPEIKSIPYNELVSEFWAASAYQTPNSQLRGIKADNLDVTKVRSPPKQHIAAASSVELSRAVQEDETRSRASSLTRRELFSGSLESLRLEHREPPTMIHPALRNLDDEPNKEQPHPSHLYAHPIRSTSAIDYNNSLDAIREEAENCSGPNSPAKGFLNLPPPPFRSPNNALLETGTTPKPLGNAFAFNPFLQDTRTSSEGGSFSADEFNVPSLTSGESWEDDVDFCYFVEAESSCDFDWDSAASSRNASVTSQYEDQSLTTPTKPAPGRRTDGGALLRPAVRHVRAKSSRALSEAALFAGFDGCHTEHPNNDAKVPSTLAARRKADSPQVSPRALPSKSTRSGDYFGFRSSFIISPLSQFNRKKELTRTRSLDSGITSHAQKDIMGRWSIATPSSLPAAALRRRKSFDGSHLPRGLVATCLPPVPPPKGALPSIPNTASSSSSTSKASKQRKRAQGLTIPIPSPPLSPVSMGSFVLATTPGSIVDPFIMRRPQSPGDRAALQAAGRAVQRERGSRPTTPSRLSHAQSSKGGATPLTSPSRQVQDQGWLRQLTTTPPTSPPQQEGWPAWI